MPRLQIVTTFFLFSQSMCLPLAIHSEPNNKMPISENDEDSDPSHHDEGEL